MRRDFFLALPFLFVSLTFASGPEVKSAFFKTSDGVRLHYLDAGKGDPIVFVPGWSIPVWI